MASGDVLVGGGEPPNDSRHWVMLDAIAATGDGVWVDTGPYTKEMEIRFTGITTVTLQIRGSSAKTIPSNSSHEAQIGSDVTANGTVDVTHPPRWMKIRVTVWTTGTTSVFMKASR